MKTAMQRWCAAIVLPSDASGCWIWQGAPNGEYGYGRFWLDSHRRVLPHRYGYERFIGGVPDGLCLDHLCRNTRCVNPAHLEPVTVGENTRRSMNPPARNARRTQCTHGHPFSGSNLYTKPDGTRQCRTCMRATHKKYRDTGRQKELRALRRCADELEGVVK